MALPTTEIKFDSTFIGRIPVLNGSKNYDVWSKRIISTLSAYSVWEFVDGTLTYAALRPSRLSIEVETSRQMYSWPYGQYD